MENSQSSVAINALEAVIKNDIYFFLRMGIRPDLHQSMYPGIPLVLPKKSVFKEERTEEIVYGEDPYKDLRKHLSPELHIEIQKKAS